MNDFQHYQFPDPEDADENGLVAVGGDLSINCLLSAYRKGIFPWFSAGDPILWWSPNPRMVIQPEKLHLSRSNRKLFKKHPYRITFDQSFAQVINACAQPRSTDQTGETGTWITDEMQAAYIKLHQQGFAHSVECWQEDKLCGGLYGVAIGSVFFGESMFSSVQGASKIALISLIKQLHQWQFTLIDCQMSSKLMILLGAYEITRSEFTQQIVEAAKTGTRSQWGTPR